MPHFSPRRRHTVAWIGACWLAMAAGAATAQTWPDKPLRILVGASPGGGTDILARVLADKLSPALRQSVVVENRPGASNTIAAELAARATPDGTTLLLATNTAQAVAPHILKLKYDPLKDLQPIGLVAVMPNVLVVSVNSPHHSVKEVQAALAAQPGAMKYASSGIGSTQHIGGEAFGMATGTRAIHVPYKGSSQAHVDLIGGSVDLMFDSTSSAMTQIRAGKLRPLAVSAPTRSSEMPQVPTLTELGIQGADVSTWYGLYTTAGAPRAVVERLVTELTQALQQPDVQARIKALGGEVGTLTGERFAEMNRSEFAHYGRLVRGANIKGE
jgi:tripartite-type tricarboxylate transporter receptor subunit TctC